MTTLVKSDVSWGIASVNAKALNISSMEIEGREGLAMGEVPEEARYGDEDDKLIP